MNDNKTQIFVVIVAGGQGTRMGLALPKQFLNIGDKPILYYTINAFLCAIPDAQIILVLPEQDVSKLQMVLAHFPHRINLTVVSGGVTRYDSVKNGLKHLPSDSLILVHDGVRPFVSEDLIKRCIDTAFIQGSAIPVIPVVDSIRMVQQDGSNPINRDSLRIIQTPQVFKGEILLTAFEQAYQSKFTDEATVIEHIGYKPYLVDGEKNNIKITTPEDLEWAELLLQRQKNKPLL